MREQFVDGIDAALTTVQQRPLECVECGNGLLQAEAVAKVSYKLMNLEHVSENACGQL